MKDPLTIIQNWIDTVWNAGDLDQLETFHPATFLNEGIPSSPDEARRWHQQQRSTFPDINYEIEDIFGTEDKIVVRWTAKGTQRGMLWGFVPPTGKNVQWKGVHIVRVESGKITEIWAVSNQVSILQQLGVQFKLPEADS